MKNAHVRVDGAPDAPGIFRAVDGVFGIFGEMHAVAGNCVADCVVFPIAVGLVKKMHLFVKYNRAGRGDAVLFACLRKREFADFMESFKVV